MILVFGGTTEGKQVIEVLNTLRKPFVYSTKTEIEPVVGDFGTYRFGAFTVKGLSNYIQNSGIKMIVHASHPFAEVLHQTIAIAAVQHQIPVYRLQREYPLRQKEQNVNYLDSYEGLKTELKQNFSHKKGLFLTGVQTISRLQYFWKEQCSYFRILDRQSSIDMALESQFPESQLILGMPNKIIENEIKLIQSLGIEFMVTKESGESGSLSLKIAAASHCGIPILIIKKPILPAHFILMESKEALENTIRKV
ncbi:precorrin-6A/cobalt-precorrin-6A reductase [Flavobacterium sp. 7A]|uniref:precorrin-6A/cobalt-precorrin-6A reductase n=1 Tax=Flavobacterium sp. 7A TaxID=2940571 RepID=UPI002227A94A|nr:precorrin-6A/cobalt-precorrin-6A reductase [Flavobacterium sp. 7A]MCW2119678.1 precorrin-6x reductase [Flavobacterium sp. 7A]